MERSRIGDQQGENSARAAEHFVFMSPYRSFRTSGCFSRFSCPAIGAQQRDSAFQQQMAAAFAQAKAAGIAQPLLVGAIPFDPQQPSELFIPQNWQNMARDTALPAACATVPCALLSVIQRQEIPAEEEFMTMVARAAHLTTTDVVDKVVLSRLIDITLQEPVDSELLFARLNAQNPASFNFHLPLADGDVLLGASPELLLRKEGDQFWSLPLAGSIRRQPDAAQDRAAGNQLLASAKDRHEHQLVIAAMKRLLTPRCRQLSLPEAPQLISTPTLWHLATSITGHAQPQENVMSLACLLHPTPALSGFPHLAAKQIIAELEPFERQLFGGIVGWCDEEGNGEWVVTIRCARLHQRTLRLFAGAGIVPASSPEGEWRETGVKLTTMLNVFGLK
ncbi:isochorismate synthase EntC [Enterobacteriaceae bacterium ESL0689]|nr:isochorismate synthase EntC [Enterobacteriaceae bacterium ESL0689]